MRNSTVLSPAAYAAEVAKCVNVVVTPDAEEDNRIKAAQHLAELGVWHRRGTRPRGTLESAAECDFPDPAHEQILLDCLTKIDGKLRRDIILALGQWGGEASAAAISSRLREATDNDNVQYCISALETIGGPTGVEALRWVASNPNSCEAIQHSARYALSQLESGGIWDYSEGVATPRRGAIAGATKKKQEVRRTLDDIGLMLTATIEGLDRIPDRRPKLQRFIGVQRQLMQGGTTWELDLLQQAHAHQWPGWAVECLPSLYIRLPESAEGREKAYVWHYLAACFPESNSCVVDERLCCGHVFKVTLDRNNVEFARFVAPILEEQRLTNPFSSTRAMAGVVIEALQSLTRIASKRQDHKAASALQRVHELILRTQDIPVPQQKYPDVYAYVEWLKRSSADPETITALETAKETLARALPASQPKTELVATALQLVVENRKEDAECVVSVTALLETTNALYHDRELWRERLRETTSKIALPEWVASIV